GGGRAPPPGPPGERPQPRWRADEEVLGGAEPRRRADDEAVGRGQGERLVAGQAVEGGQQRRPGQQDALAVADGDAVVGGREREGGAGPVDRVEAALVVPRGAPEARDVERAASGEEGIHTPGRAPGNRAPGRTRPRAEL